jgi:GNAT superfamily N-acetyltransferase
MRKGNGIGREITNVPVGMRPGRRELNDCSLQVSLSQAVPEHMRERVREISHLFTKPEARGQRLATALLNFVCQEADANGMTLILTARPSDDDGAPEDVLLKWYAKFGFRQLQDSENGIILGRQVHEKPRLVQPNVVGASVREAIMTAQRLN